MKKSIILIFLITPFIVAAQSKADLPNIPIDSVTDKITYSEVVYVDSTTKDVLYSRAIEWFTKTYGSSKEVIEVEDKINGKVIGKGLIQCYSKVMGTTYPAGYLHYVISIFVKDGRYKYVMTNFYHRGQMTSGGMQEDMGDCETMLDGVENYNGFNVKAHKKAFISTLIEMNNGAIDLINSLNRAMKQPTTNEKDW